MDNTNKHIFILAVLLLVIFLVSGCTIKLPSVGAMNTLDIIKNPEKYDGKNITIVARPQFNALVSNLPGLGYKIVEKDEEGRPISMKVKYGRFYCYSCEITGTVKTLDTCQCQTFRCFPNSEKCSEWVDDPSLIPWQVAASRTELIEECEKETEIIGAGKSEFSKLYIFHRCIPESLGKTYYIDVTKVKSLD